MTRHLDVADPARTSGDQLAAARVRGETDGSGVRRRPRDAVDADDEPDVEPVRQADHRRGEPLPLEVGLGAVEQVELLPVGRGHGVHHEPVLLHVGEPVLPEHHPRAAAAVVDQLVGVEDGDLAAGQLAQQVLDGQARGAAGVDETVQGVHQRRPGAGLDDRLGVEVVEAVGVEHGSPRLFLRSTTPGPRRGFRRGPGGATPRSGPQGPGATGRPASRHATKPPTTSVARCRPIAWREAAARLEAPPPEQRTTTRSS